MSAKLAQATESYSWGNVRFDGGGFVSAVVTSRTHKNLVYARTDVGGAYRWNAASNRWIPLMDWVSEKDMGIMGTEALALDPKDPAKLYILGGTDYFSNGRTWILRSSDFGATFDTTDVTTLFKAHGNGLGRQSGEKLAVDPNNGRVIWCGSRLKGLFRSVDGGKIWLQADTLGSKSGGSTVNDVGVSFVVLDSASGIVDGVTKTMYVGVGRTGANLYRSTDGGKTFAAVTGGPASLMPLRAVLAGGHLLVSYSSGPGPHSVSSGAIWKHAVATGAWTNITPKDASGYYGDGSQARGGALGGISADPGDPNHLVASTLCHYGGQWRHPSKKDGWGDKIFESRDGGATWTLLNAYADNVGTNANVDPDGTNWISGHAVHWAGSVEFDPFDTKRVWVTSGNGIFRSDDVSASLPVWKFAAHGLEEVVPFEALSIPAGPMVTAIGDYDGSAYDDISKSYPLHSPQFGTTLSLGYAPANHKLLRIGTEVTYPSGVETKRNRGFLSSDMGQTWTAIDSAPAGKGMTSLNADGTVFFHRAEGASSILRSDDNGKTWSKVTGLNEGQSQNSPLIPDPVEPKQFYLLDAQGDMYKSFDAGATFAKQGSVQDNAKNLWQASSGKIVALPGKSGELWIPLDQAQSWVKGGYSTNGLAYTIDGGKSFVRLDTSVVQICVAIGLGKAAVGASYPTLFLWGAAAHGPIGMYRSTDKGASWIRINDDAHQFGGAGNGQLVRGDWNVFGRVYMSSAGRGLVYGEPSSITAGLRSGSNDAATKAHMVVTSNRIRVQAFGESALHLELRDAGGRLLLSARVNDGQSLNLEGLGKGMAFARLSSHGRTLAIRSVLQP